MDFTTTTLFIILFFLILLSGFFSGSETGMMSINRYRLRHMVKSKNKTAERVQKLLERPDRLLGVILIGNTFANILAAAIATILAVRLMGDVGIAIATLLLTLVILIFAEVAPKTVAALYPQHFAFIVSRPLALLLKILYPLVWLTNFAANNFLRLFGINVKKRSVEHLSTEELKTIVHEAGGRIPSGHQDMLLRIFDLEKVTVDDIMIPKNELIGIDVSDEWKNILAQLTNSQHTRLPIYHDNIDKVEGVLHLRNALNLLAKDNLNKNTMLTAADAPYFVPEGTPLHTQLINFKNEKCRSALVVDEYGDIQGLVTLEDILEEIVGEFTTDITTANKEVHPQSDGTFLVDGTVTLRDLNRMMDWEFDTEGPKTLSGLIVEYLEAMPEPGTSMLLSGYPVEVVAVKDNMVKTARVLPELRKVEVEEED